MKNWIFLFTLLVLTSCGSDGSADMSNDENTELGADGYDHIYAIIYTEKGEIVMDLAYEHTPKTVANFIALATGELRTEHNELNQPYYDGLTFHRVEKNFMIQGGDPEGTGMGGPGYFIPDEITNLKHDRAGTLSMANSGPNRNGSQFFITHKDTPWLDGKHTVFGYVIKGQNVVDAIVPGDVIEHIEIQAVGESAQRFDPMVHIKGRSKRH